MAQEIAQQQKQIVRLDRAQASAAQMRSMGSFHDRPVSQGLSRKTTPAPSSDTGMGVVSGVDIDKIKLRLTEVEKVLMANQLTMKQLGEHTDDASVSNGRKSNGKFD